MKKIISICLAMVLLLATVTVAYSKDTKTYPTGDLDGDNKITLMDAQKILKIALVIEKCDNPAIADINNDGKVNLTDAQLALKVALAIVKYEDIANINPSDFTEEPTVEPTTKPAVEPTEQPTLEPVTKPAIEPTTGEAVKPATEPAIETPTEEHVYDWVVDETNQTRTRTCSSCGVTTGAVEACYDGLWGYFAETDSETILSEINKIRLNIVLYSGYDPVLDAYYAATMCPLKYEEEMNQNAKINVIEYCRTNTVGEDMSVVAIKNESSEDAYTVIAFNETDEKEIIKMVSEQSDTKTAITDSGQDSMGYACFMYDRNNDGTYIPIWYFEVK